MLVVVPSLDGQVYDETSLVVEDSSANRTLVQAILVNPRIMFFQTPKVLGDLFADGALEH
jgi:hypothetical protein